MSQLNVLRISIVFLFFLFPLFLNGQKSHIPINISLFNESTSIPFTRIFSGPIHPGIMLGTEFNYKDKSSSRFFQTANLSYFYHNYLNQGIGITTDFGYEYRTQFGLAASGMIGVGYMHTFATTEEFTFENGEYVKKRDGGNARLVPSFSLELGYYFCKVKALSPKIFIRIQSWIEYPYSPGFIPVMTHNNIHIGTQFFIAKRKSLDESH